MVKTTKGGKVMNPTDAYRKELRKKELKRNKKERKKVREVGILKKDPEVIKDQIQKLELMKADGALDKARKHKKRQLEDTLNLVMKKRKEYEDKMKEKGETPVMFSHLGPPRRRTSAEEDERVKHPKPEDSVYYHPTLNPTGAPPPGKPPMYKSSIGPRIPLSGDSLGADASTSRTEGEEDASLVPVPSAENILDDGSVVPASLPVPPPPPTPPNAASINMGISLPPPPLPPPPPGPPPKDQVPIHTHLPPPPLLQVSMQPALASANENEDNRKSSTVSQESSSKDVQVSSNLTLIPPASIPVRSMSILSESSSSENNVNVAASMENVRPLPPPPPPPRQHQPPPVPSLTSTLQPDIFPPAIPRFPPLPPLNMMLPISAPGHPGQIATPGTMAPLLPRPPYGPPPGSPALFRPPLPPGPPPMLQDETFARPFVPPKPSYIKSAASTVVKRPLAQNNPELTSMVPASVRVRRETAVAKPKAKPSLLGSGTVTKSAAPSISKPDSVGPSSFQKTQSIDDSYTAFLEDMKALGALDS